MSKAEERAFERCPQSENLIEELRNKRRRAIFIEGYHQAEKDLLELTWEDMFTIFHLVNEVLDDYAEGKTKKEVGEEVLKRFKDFRERKEK